MKIATLVVSAAVLICLSLPAKAQQNLVKFIEHYNGVQVRIEASSVKCDISDTNLYIKKVGEGLQAIGITPDPLALTRAYLFIWALPFGALGQQCATFMSLRLGADVSSAVARIDAKITSDKILIEKIKVVAGTYPAAFYLTTRLFVKTRINTPEQVLTAIGQLMNDVDKDRKS
jgi:hypothetical protein